MELQDYSKRKIEESQQFLKNYKPDWLHKKIDSYLFAWVKVLDLWCGPATFDEFHHTIPMDYYGVDHDMWFVQSAKERGKKVEQYDIMDESLPYADNSFDFVFCRHVIEHVPTDGQLKLVSEISRVLKPGWTTMILRPTAYHWYFWDDPTHYRPCTHGQFYHLANDFGLNIIECKYSLTRFFSNNLQRFLRLPPLRWFLWEVFLVAKKK